eukprot:589462-Amphidinium_carterae.1
MSTSPSTSTSSTASTWVSSNTSTVHWGHFRLPPNNVHGAPASSTHVSSSTMRLSLCTTIAELGPASVVPPPIGSGHSNGTSTRTSCSLSTSSTSTPSP